MWPLSSERSVRRMPRGIVHAATKAIAALLHPLCGLLRKAEIGELRITSPCLYPLEFARIGPGS